MYSNILYLICLSNIYEIKTNLILRAVYLNYTFNALSINKNSGYKKCPDTRF